VYLQDVLELFSLGEMSNTPTPAPLRLRAPSKYIIQCSGRSLGGSIWISVHADTKSARISDVIACQDKTRCQTFRALPTT
jgi:hypothetical protein